MMRREFNAETTGVHFHILLPSITKFDQQIVFVFAKQRFAFLGNKGKIVRPVCGIKTANMRQFLPKKITAASVIHEIALVL